MKEIFKKIALFFLEVAVLLAIIFGFRFYRDSKNVENFVDEIKTQVEQKKDFPRLENPVVKKYAWIFKGKNYEISETLYESVAEYYKNQPKDYRYVGTPENNWEESYYSLFLKTDGDFLIANVAKDVEAQGRKNKLSDDEIVDLIITFVQAIPYDDAKASLILSGSADVSVEYPYETLFSNSGVCSDKSFLATMLLRSLGYGTALFVYDQENHMAIGIQCPLQYSTYGSGYCYGETTSTGNKIGIIPSLDKSNKASATIFSFDQSQQNAARELGSVAIYQKSEGKLYGGISKTFADEKEMITLKKDIATLGQKLQAGQKAISLQQKNLESLKNNFDKLQKNGDIEKYNAQVEIFNNLLEENKKAIAEYNKQVTLYNQKVTRYNSLLTE